MLSSRIWLLEKFGTSLVVISYFGPAHKSFLLLSQFNKKSREMMDKKFEGIMNWIVRTSICLKIEVNIKRIFLPWNLFRFDISINTEQWMKAFLKLIQNINDKNGYFFNEHFLHSRLLIDQLNIKTELIKNLYPAIKLLEEIEIIHSTITWDKLMH